MTEEEWLASSSVRGTTECLRTQFREAFRRHVPWPSDFMQPVTREVRLFACGCCRLVQQLLDPNVRQALEVVEAFADGEVGMEQLDEAATEVNALHPEIESAPHRYAARAVYKSCEIGSGARRVHSAWEDVELALEGEAIIAENPPEHIQEALDAWVEAHSGSTIGCTERDVSKLVADLLRCIVGNPFRPVAFEPAWRTEHTVGIAGKMYDERDFRAMPILADALEEAGCDSADVLAHSREPGPHARGCWVVDEVLGKR
jgi:hypothetical protein